MSQDQPFLQFLVCVTEFVTDIREIRGGVKCKGIISCVRPKLLAREKVYLWGPFVGIQPRLKNMFLKKCTDTDCQHHRLAIMLVSHLLLYIEGGANSI